MRLRVGFLLLLFLGLSPENGRCAGKFDNFFGVFFPFFITHQDPPFNYLADEPAPNTAQCRILVFEYAAYDSIYASKLKFYISKNLPGADFKNFWKGTAADLENALADRQIALLPYPSKGDFSKLKNFGMVLRAFVRRGGSVIFTGTHDYEVLRQLGLVDLDYAYYFPDPNIHRQAVDHPISAGLPANFSLTNYAYPLDISDPEFVTLADVNGYATAGYKNLGKGSIIYLGFEFYYDEVVSTRLLINALTWGNRFAVPVAAPISEKPIRRPKRITLQLKPNEYPAKDSYKLNIYPNPFYEKADLELSIGEPTPVSIEITDNLGTLVTNMIDRKTLGAGKHVLELPELPTGIFFVKIKCGNSTTVRKIVKIETQ